MLSNMLYNLPHINSGPAAARMYILFILPALIALNFIFINFHAPDDYDHFKRAYSVLHRTILPTTQPGRNSGALIDSGLAQYIEAQRPAIFDWPRSAAAQPGRDGAEARFAAARLRWTQDLVYSEFPGSISYIPVIYLPQTAAIWVGIKLEMTIEDTVILTRFTNGITAVLISAASLALMPFGAGAVLFILLLPKTLLHLASNSVDPLLHAVTLVVLAFTLSALATEWRPRLVHYALVALAIVVVAGVRPPFGIIAVLPAWVAWKQRRPMAIIIVVFSALLPVLWFAAVTPQIVDLRCGPTGSLASKLGTFAIHGPALVLRSIYWHHVYYLASFVGELGWGDGPSSSYNSLPYWIYPHAAVIMVLAIAHVGQEQAGIPMMLRFLLLASGAIFTLGVFFAMYAVCTSPDRMSIGGVQGRYFVTPFLLGIPALVGLWRRTDIIARAYPAALLLFACTGVGTLISEGLRIYWSAP